ncbi:MAG TPA: MFS transporter [Alteraurantiacibacter sp.]
MHPPGPSFQRRLEGMPIRGYQVGLVVLLLLVLVIDGIDIQLLSLVAPVILEEWQVQRADFGPALAGALLGMSVGSLAGGALGDRYGRLRLLVFSTALFGMATIGAGLTTGVGAMTVLRVISGIGFGAAAPNAIALAVDWLPERARAQVTSLLSIGTPAGGMIGASLVILLLPQWGWRGTFYACGVLTLLFAIAVMLRVHESPPYLASKGRTRAAADAARRRLGVEWVPDASEKANGIVHEKRERLLTRQNLRLNVGAGLGFFALAWASYGLVGWTAILLTSMGFAMDEAVTAVFSFNLAAMMAALAAGFLMRWFGSRIVLFIASCGVFTCVSALALLLDADAAETSRKATYLLVGGAGGSAGAALAAIYTMMAIGYPVGCRSAGLGLGLMFGRAGGIAASFIGGMLIDLGGGASWVFLGALAIAGLVGALCAFVSDKHLPPRQAQDIGSASRSRGWSRISNLGRTRWSGRFGKKSK